MRNLSLNTLTLLLLLVVGFVLRVTLPSRMAVEHFDEGVYASNLYSDHIGFEYPDRQYYAPPLLPAIFEWVMVFTGASSHAVMWVNVVFGTGLIFAVWWTTKELLQTSTPISTPASAKWDLVAVIQQGASLSAAAMVACGDFFIQYSRAALTDIPVTFWMVSAVGCGARALRTGSWKWSAASAMLTSCAWWTKYNGWLPLAILGAGLAGWLVLTQLGRSSLSGASLLATPPEKKKGSNRSQSSGTVSGWQPVVLFAAIALGAFLLWVPCLNSLQATGGYAAVAKNHQGYLVGWSGWGESVSKHVFVNWYYSNLPTICGLFIAIVIPFQRGTYIDSYLQLQNRPLFFGGPILLFGAMISVVIAGLLPLLLVLTTIAFVFWKKHVNASLRELEAPAAGNLDAANAPALRTLPLGMWILLAWILGLLLTTPLYRPYPRLILPLLTALVMGAAIGVSVLVSVLRGWRGATIGQRPLKELSVPIILKMVPLTASIFVSVVPTVVTLNRTVFLPALQDRTGFVSVTSEVLAAIEKDLEVHQKSELSNIDCVIYVLAEPGLYYQLAARENEGLKYISQPASDLGMLSSGKVDGKVPAYLVTGMHAQKEIEQLDLEFNRILEVTTLDFTPSDLVLLDDMTPRELSNHRDQKVRLWRINRDH
ncbi:ArnT family glycosyltransferase [Planctomicrobium sp. SH668]|uniref:ArnT family glycosyltransferase n=1 Tax=Planctomicrobium sp. SH668 TaxID=3448126 RepID=UPI003F5CB15C